MSENIPIKDKKAAHASETEVNIVQEIGKTADDLVKKQLALSAAKIQFNDHVTNAKISVNKSIERIFEFAAKTKESLMQQIDDIASRRRLEMEIMSTALINAQPDLLQLASRGIKSLKNEDWAKTEKKDGKTNEQYLAEIQYWINSAFSGEKWEKEALTEIDLVWNDSIGQMIDSEPGSLHKFIRVINYLSSEELTLNLINFVPEELKVDISIESSDKLISSALFPEIDLEIYTVRNTVEAVNGELLHKLFTGKTSVKELISEGQANFQNSRRITVSCPVDLSILNEVMLIVQVCLSGVPISGSPLTLSIENDENAGNNLSQKVEKQNSVLWRSLSFSKDIGCITRDSKTTNDLDKSDLKAMGYLEQTHGARLPSVNSRRLSTVLECYNENPSTEDTEINESYSKLPNEKLGIGNQLPLNQPSPVTFFKKPLSIISPNTIAVASPTQNNFLPSIKSTDINLEKKLKEFNEKQSQMNLSDNNPKDSANGSFNVLEEDSQAQLDLSQLQARLSGKFKSNKHLNPNYDVNGKKADKTRKNVSFHDSTNINEKTSDTDKNVSTTLQHAETLPYKPGTIDTATLYQDDIEDQLPWQINMSQMKITDDLPLYRSKRPEMKNDHGMSAQSNNIFDRTFVTNDTQYSIDADIDETLPTFNKA